MPTFPAQHLSVTIDQAPQQVYAFAADPANLPRWAAGLAGAIREDGGEWVAESPMGKVSVVFTAENPYGVLDHDVTLPSGDTVHNPLRVVANGDGSDVIFSLFRLPGVTDEAFADDAAAVTRDLEQLKALLES